MNRKKISSPVFEEGKPNLTVEESYSDIERLQEKITLRQATLEEKIQEASKPLYLKRYE